MEGRKVPKIRFQEFADEWEQRKFEDVATKISESSSNDTVLPRIEYEDINSGAGSLNKNIYEKDSDKIGIKFNKDDVLYGKLRPYLNKWIKPDFNGVAVGDFWVLRSNECSQNFLFSLIQSDNFQNVANISVGTKMPRADWKLVSQEIFSIPKSIEEQEKIGVYFAKLDEFIAIYQSKVEKLKLFKEAMLDKMFPKNGKKIPEVRFKGFTGAWEQRKLKDVAYKVTEKNIDFAILEIFTNSAEYGVISQRDFFDHDIAKTENIDRYYVVEEDNFVYNPRISIAAPVGPINRNKLGRKGVISPLYTVFKTHDIDNTFLEYFFKGNTWHPYMYFNGDTGARFDRFSIKSEVFFDMPILYPKLEEQRLISRYLEQLDNLDSFFQRKNEKLQDIKKTMLERMFM